MVVLADRTAGEPPDAGGVVRCWDRPDWEIDVATAAGGVRPDVVHIQHGAHFGDGESTVRLARALRKQGIPLVVTLHDVYPSSLFRPQPRRFHQALGDAASRIIVHQAAGSVPVLKGHGVPDDKIEVVPHGTNEDGSIEQQLARRQLGLASETPIVLFLGFIFRRKGVHTIVKAFSRVARELPQARLVIAGELRHRYWSDGTYHRWLARRLRAGRTTGWLDYRPGHVPEELLRVYIAAADVVVFPYNRAYGSSSGVFHRTLAAGRAAMCSRCPTFGEAEEAWAQDLPEVFVDPGDPAAWARAMIQLLQDEGLRARAAAAASTLGRRSAWSEVADRHMQVYRSVRD